MATKLFERQAALYATYHRDRRNRATHMIGIPAIMFSLLVLAAAWRVPVGSADISAAWIVAGLAALGWLVLDLALGLAMIAALALMTIAAAWIAAAFGPTACWTVAAVFFVGGWVFQLIGHVFEGRRPALVDNLFQAFIGPMFIMAEFLELLGLRRRHFPRSPAA
jgi:uncharacterized membrane protein YGL010W